MPRSTRTALAALVALSALAAPSLASASDLGPLPRFCVEPYGYGCLTKGGGGEVTVSPKVVQVGDVFTVRLESVDAEYGGVAWKPGEPFFSASGPKGRSGFAKLLGCKARKVAKPVELNFAEFGLAGAMTRRYRALRPSGSWQVVQVPFSVRWGGLGSTDGDYVGVIGDDESYVSGTITGLALDGKQGAGIRGMTVLLKGRKPRRATTDALGFFAAKVAEGSYRVVPELRASDERLRPRPQVRPAGRDVRIPPADRVVDVDFTLTRKDGVRVAFLPAAGASEPAAGSDDPAAVASVAADGATPFAVVLRATDVNDDPLANRALELVVDGATLSPRAVLCRPGAGRVWPGVALGDSRSVLPLDGVPATSAAGEVRLLAFPGTQAGTFSLRARFAGAPAADAGTLAELPFTEVPPQPYNAGVFAAALAAVSGLPGGPPEPTGGVGTTVVQRDLVLYLAWMKEQGQLRGLDLLPVRNADRGAAVLLSAQGTTTVAGGLVTPGPDAVVVPDGPFGTTVLRIGTPKAVGEWLAGSTAPITLSFDGGAYPGVALDLTLNGWPAPTQAFNSSCGGV